jgi:cbb3-type cytochrome oxidase maturation protein
MNVPPAVILLLAIALAGAAFALAAFVWAVRTGQLDPGAQGAGIIFQDGDDPTRR